jgi:hypothetical protein
LLKRLLAFAKEI